MPDGTVGSHWKETKIPSGNCRNSLEKYHFQTYSKANNEMLKCCSCE